MASPLHTYRAAVVLLAAALVATLTVALTGGQRADAVDGPVEVVYVATGQNFPDALAGANLAATVGAPMLTVNPDLPIPDPTITALQALDPDQIIILGGPVAVSDPVADALTDYARSGSVTRIEGGDRHDTAAQIADALPDKVHDADRLDGLDSTDFLRTTAGADLRVLPLGNWTFFGGDAVPAEAGPRLAATNESEVTGTFIMPPGHTPGGPLSLDLVFTDHTSVDCNVAMTTWTISGAPGDAGSPAGYQWRPVGTDVTFSADWDLPIPTGVSTHAVTLVPHPDLVADGRDVPGSSHSLRVIRSAFDAADTCPNAITLAGAQLRY